MEFQRRSHALKVAAVLSVLFHLAGLMYFSRVRTVVESGLDLQEVSFMDVTYRPEVAKVLPKSQMTGGGGGSMEAPAGPVPTYASGVAADQVPALDMSATLERNEAQAKIDLNRYELDRGSGGLDVIRIGGRSSAQSTEEILAQPTVSLARGSGGPGSGLGLRGVPGVPQVQAQPQLTIEHRPLAKPAARALPQLPTQPTPTVAAPVKSGTSFQIAGPISQREILKKVKPRYPKWALDQRISGTVTVRIWVLPNGKVKGSGQVLSSSGYPDLDQVVIEALRCWEFAPLGPDVKAEEQWGDITFIFLLS
ncbi:MAG: energy transducer TonB [candidate division WOR-3 bacterium]